MKSNNKENKFILILAAIVTVLRIFASVYGLGLFNGSAAGVNKSLPYTVCYLSLIALVTVLLFVFTAGVIKKPVSLMPYFVALFFVNSVFWNLLSNNRNILIFLLAVLVLSVYRRSVAAKLLLPLTALCSAAVYPAYIIGVLPSVLLLATVQYIEAEKGKKTDTVAIDFGSRGLLTKLSLWFTATAALVGTVMSFKLKGGETTEKVKEFLEFPRVLSFTAYQLTKFLLPVLLVSALIFVLFIRECEKKNNKKLQSFFMRAGGFALLAYGLELCSYFTKAQVCPIPISLFLTPAFVWRMQKIGNRCVTGTANKLNGKIKEHFLLTAVVMFALAVFYFYGVQFLSGIKVNDLL